RLEHCLDEHSGEYIRMFGIDAQSKSRTATTTIQRADGKPVDIAVRAVAPASGASQSSAGGYAQSPASGGSSASGEAAQAVSQIIRSGNKVGIEFADKRRYRSGIWQTAPSINASSESGAVSQLQSFLSQNSDKYVRIFGVNAQQKTRGAATTVQKPGQGGAQSKGGQSSVSTNGREAARGPVNNNPPHYDDPSFRSQSSGGVDPSVANQVAQLVSQGHKISIEFADKRRYRSGIWKTGPAISARRPGDAIAALNQQLAEHSNDYVKLIGTDTQMKRRVVEVTIHRPGQPATVGAPSSGGGRAPANANSPSFNNQSNGSGGGMESSVMDQVTQLVNQGHKISLEYADKRRYRSGIWKTGEAISARRPAEAISALGKQLARHQGEYVRLVGVDPQAKRRVLEATIQRP
ncbi:MAG: ribulose bisphosphate carboxylase small subunit, partial [Cyanobacteria bacterium P01_D01_bin.36]